MITHHAKCVTNGWIVHASIIVHLATRLVVMVNAMVQIKNAVRVYIFAAKTTSVALEIAALKVNVRHVQGKVVRFVVVIRVNIVVMMEQDYVVIRLKIVVVETVVSLSIARYV